MENNVHPVFPPGIKIQGIQFTENLIIMLHQCIDAAVHLAADLACMAEHIFVVHQKPGQIAMPEVSFKSIGSGKLCQFMDAGKIKTPKESKTGISSVSVPSTINAISFKI